MMPINLHLLGGGLQDVEIGSLGRKVGNPILFWWSKSAKMEWVVIKRY